MSDDHEDKDHEHRRRHELNDLVRTLIEVQVAGNDLLAALNRKIDTTICVLEHVSRNTCETLNKLHELAECKDKQACQPCPPAEVCCAKPPAPPEKPEPPCRYEPCKPGEELGDWMFPDRAARRPGVRLARPIRRRRPRPVRAARQRARAQSPAWAVPRISGARQCARAAGFPLRGRRRRGDDPVVFGVYTTTGGVASPMSTGAADVSGAESGNVVLATGNWYLLYSLDGGSTFTTLDPTTVFDNTADGGFCCDQIIQYVPSIDRFIWLMQFNTGANGKNRLRIAAASPESVNSSKCTAWTYWDLTSDALGIVTTAADATNGIHWLDYPAMSVGTSFLYVSIDNVGMASHAPNRWADHRAHFAGGHFRRGHDQFRLHQLGDAGLAYSSHVTQNTGDEAYWAGNRNNSTMQVFSWKEDSAPISGAMSG